MTDVRLDRTDRAGTGCCGPRRERLGESRDLDRIPQRRAGAVRLDIRDRLSATAGERLCLDDDGGLTTHAGSRVAGLCAAVVVDRRSLDHGMDPVAVGQCIGQPLQDDDTDAATDDRPLCAGVKGPATAVR